ncbi:hypothetical protein ACYOEI_25885, partial [Singulisphaera rosea]
KTTPPLGETPGGGDRSSRPGTNPERPQSDPLYRHARPADKRKSGAFGTFAYRFNGTIEAPPAEEASRTARASFANLVNSPVLD